MEINIIQIKLLKVRFSGGGGGSTSNPPGGYGPADYIRLLFANKYTFIYLFIYLMLFIYLIFIYLSTQFIHSLFIFICLLVIY